MPGPARPFRLRQNHPAPPARRAGNTRRRRNLDRRPARRPARAGATRCGDGVPELRPLSASFRFRQHRVPAADTPHRSRRDRSARARVGGSPRPDPTAGAAPVGRMDLRAGRRAQFSGGQQQRVALARAIVRNPTVYLMDEPLSNLDAQLRLQTRTELKRLHRELGTTMIYVTHDQSEAMTLGGRIAIMQHGSIVQIGAPLDLYRQPVNTFVGTFLGSPPMNLIAGNGIAVTIGVRAEDVVVAASPDAAFEEARVVVVEPMGSETLVTLEYRAQRLVARLAGDAHFEPGQIAWIRLPPERVLTFDASGARIG